MSKFKPTKPRFLDTLFKDRGSISLTQLDALIEREAFTRIEKTVGGPLENSPTSAKVKAWPQKKPSKEKQSQG